MKIFILCLLYNAAIQEAANILYIIPFTSTSHYHLLGPLGIELASRGHNITVITSHVEKDHPPNYNQVIVDDIKIWDSIEGGRPNVFKMVDISVEEFHDKILFKGGLATTENALKSSKVKEFMMKKNKFDLVISELFYQEAMYMFAHIYQAPLVLITTYGNCMKNNIVMRNPLHLATVLEEFSMVRDPWSFEGRLKNFYYSFHEYLWWYYWYMPRQEELVSKYFKNIPKPVPALYELHQNVSLVLINGHFSIDTPAAYPPNVIEVGGLHLKDSDSKLPKDIQKMMDDAKHGVIYMSFGSNVKSSELPADKKNAFLNVFRRLKYTVLWKWEEPNLENKPDNVIIRKWMPQKEILAHPNVKLFIAHGGLIGLQEATFRGVPIIGIPIYADQYNNLLQAEEHGYGKILEYHDISENNLEVTLLDVLKDSKYKQKAKELSDRFKDRPMKPLDTAIFWIEYVIRHKGADFMKNPALKLNMWSYKMWDVYILVLVVFCVLLAIIFKIILLLRHLLFGQTKTNVNEFKKRKKYN